MWREYEISGRVGRLMRRVVALFVVGIVSSVLLGASSASAASVWWNVSPRSVPTHLQAGGEGILVISAANLGYTNADGSSVPLRITDALPPGLTATSVQAAAGFLARFSWDEPEPECTLTPLSCNYKGILTPYERMWMIVKVAVSATASQGEVNQVVVEGAGGATKTVNSTIAVDGALPEYGLEAFTLVPEDDTGQPASQAGSHPFQLTTTFAFNKTERMPFINPNESAPLQPELPKELVTKLPPGLVGNPTPFPKCTTAQFATGLSEEANACPDDTAVGVANIVIDEPNLFGFRTFTAPVFSLVPERGEPARFGFTVLGAPVYLDASVRTGGDYGVTVDVNNITQLTTFLESEVTFWGVPGDTRHDNSRGWYCAPTEAEKYSGIPCSPLNEKHPQPLLSLPTSCTGPLQASVETDSWKEPGRRLTFAPTEPMGALDGCNRLGFEPSIMVAPDGEAGSTPSGLTVGLHVPQDESLVPTGLSEANVRDTTVSLPEGLVLNPAAADGLLACSLQQVALESAGASMCPDASKVGTVTIHSPLLPDPLTGAAFLAAQDANPFGSLVALYVVAEDAKAGVLVKLAGEVHLTESGQIVSTFKDTPQLPFEDFELHFFGGDRAPLGTPQACGSYTTNASISPWSGNEPAAASSTFQITSGPGGSACQSPAGFAPSLTGGTTSIQAGGFSPFTTTISREDGQQDMRSIVLHMPPGLSGTLTGVSLCGEVDANAGTCGPDSLIGETIVSVGLGGDPFSVKGGKVYLTGPYEGAPFGLSIVNPAKAGPFDLGQVVVRARIEVDPITTALTVTTDSSGPYAIPHILDGIPLQIKHVNVTIDRSRFTFNPTSCNPMAITGSIMSTGGVSSEVQVPFQVTNCAVLGFKPQFKVSTSGRTSRARGASLHVRVSYPKAAFGSQANIRSVKVNLPRELPSRLTTLQKACPARVFNENPAACPPGSRVGSARATTPIIPVALSGPAYFVSYGGAKFPELVVVLSGYGVTVDLHGETFISEKTGITSSTFRTVPDVPVGSFELTLPQGANSALAANGNLCQKRLVMPTVFTAQNGMTIHQNTPITLTGCPKKTKQKARKAGSAPHRAANHGTRRR